MPDIILYSFSVAICFLIGVLAIFHFKVNRKGNFWFGLFLISLGFSLLGKIAWQNGLSIQYPNIIPVSELSTFIIAPAFYLGIWYYTQTTTLKRSVKILHFLPAILFASVISVPSFIFSTTLTQSLPDSAKFILGNLMKVIIPVQIAIYWLLSFRLLQKHRNHIRLFFIGKTSISLMWLTGILILHFLVIVIWIATKLTGNELPGHSAPYLYLVITLFIAYNLLNQEEVFFKAENQGLSIATPDDDKGYNVPVSRLNDKEFSFYKAQLHTILETEEIYLNPSLNLQLLSEKIGLSLNDTSYLINTAYEINFYTLINQYRIAKVKKMMADEKYNHLSLLGIAYEAGFTSKSTFNAVFKKTLGVTPTAYMKDLCK